MLSSKNESKVEERFQARIDLLAERLDTLATTVATTASGMAKKDGEIASLRRELQQRDEQIQALAARQAAVGGADPAQLDELRRTVAILVAERSKAAGANGVHQLSEKLTLLDQRLETLSTTVSTTAAGLAGRDGELALLRKQLEALPVAEAASAGDPDFHRQVAELGASFTDVSLRLEGQASELQAVQAQLAESSAPAEELRAVLTTLRGRVESLDGLRSGVTEERLDERLAETTAELESTTRHVEALSARMETATASLANKEHELAALHRHFTESSTRIESIVDDLRAALAAFPEASPEALAATAAKLDAAVGQIADIRERLDRIEAAQPEQPVADLSARVEAVDKRLSSVAAEIARAKTLWPVALRSLEARLDDVSSGRAHDETVAATSDTTDEDGSAVEADDLLAGLRDSLQAMESVAAEMERAPEPEPALTPEAEAQPEPAVQAPETAAETSPTPPAQALVAGARIVPLRASDP